MLRKIDHNAMGKSNLDWLKSVFHFSFSDYYNPNNMNFGVLRVLNDDLISPRTGFDTHPHDNMEIISYIVKGELTHGDSMNNTSKLHRGHVQYMSAGTGITHSEFNNAAPVLRILQMWILPDQKGLTPKYGEHKFNWPERVNKPLHIFSGMNGDAPIKINQDVNGYVMYLDRKQKVTFEVGEDRQAYLVQIEGTSVINGLTLNARDALEIYSEDILIKSLGECHCLIVEMALDN
jgi:hypothetical protein